jgi:hypothetical protein
MKNKNSKEDFKSTFVTLKEILKDFESHLKVLSDQNDAYNLNAGFSNKFNKDIYFGGVQVKKNYVSFYLFPVYMNPELLVGISPELKKRMQGKSCFNFKVIDKDLLAELSELTKKGFEYYKKEKMI